MDNPDAVVVGAGPAGLAAAASLQMQGMRAVILDKADKIGSTWRRHYDRLRLHTDRGHSGLPWLPMSITLACRPPARLALLSALSAAEIKSFGTQATSAFPPIARDEVKQPPATDSVILLSPVNSVRGICKSRTASIAR